MDVFEQLIKDYAEDVEIKSPVFYEKILAGLVYWADLDLKNLEFELEDNGRINKTADMQNILTELSQLIIEDPLTGLYNRRYFNRALKIEIERNSREHKPLALAIIDIDYFKNVNDTWGHDVGDIVLKQVTMIMTNNVRQSDSLVRLGGEEFAVIMPNIRYNLAVEVMQRLRNDIANSVIPFENGELNVTVSIGTTVTKPNQIISIDELYNQSDKALYEAKNTGRNKVVIHGTAESTALSVSEREALL